LQFYVWSYGVGGEFPNYVVYKSPNFLGETTL